MLQTIKATSETTLLNQNFNNASNHQGHIRNHSLESKVQQMLLHNIKATSESSIY
jgi:hypothetical protein